MRWLCILCVPFLLGYVACESGVEEKVCIGSNGRMSVPQNREHHYRNLRDRYTNCTYVDGNLELTWLQNENFDLSFLQYIREVTGYVLISHVDVSRIVLPKLQIIRGRSLFKLNIQEAEFALMVTLSKMNSLEMPALRDILHGNVGFFNNYNLCYTKTINWEEILSGANATNYYVYNFTNSERECPPCHKSCTAGCWGEGPDNCQKFSKINCSPQCVGGRCFGTNPRECCHLFCAGGCTGPTQSDCLACRNVYDDGTCSQECPPMQIYNPSTYAWETNPKGKYAYGATCVKQCPAHLLKDNGACVKSCPANKRALNYECVPCEGTCPKTCKGVAQIDDSNIDSFKDCTVIEGSISILDTTFKGYQKFDENYAPVGKVNATHPDRLEVFSTLKEVTGYINIQGYHEAFTNLSYFRNLEIIGGRELTQHFFASLYIVKTSLKFLGLTSLREIRSGSVSILENKHLCFIEGMNWKKFKQSKEHAAMLQNNKAFDECNKENHTCDPECSKEGCWGPGPHQCLSCAHLQYGNQCIPSCDVKPGLYKANSSQCMPCHEECQSICTGPGAENCKICKHVRNGNTCAVQCPLGKYNDAGICRDCHSNCVDGCVGPENTVGANACVSCERAIINGNVVERCLRKDEECPVGYYQEYVGPQDNEALKTLSGKILCRKCHPRCKKCTGYSFHEPLCQECVNYKRDSTCEDECPHSYYADNITQSCIPCSVECDGCNGPDSTHCLKCRNLKVYLGPEPYTNSTSFNCTSFCPQEFPYVMSSDGSDGVKERYCTVESVHALHSSDNRQSTIIYVAFGACLVFFACFLCVMGLQWQKRKVKENIVKMTMVLTGIEDSEPLHPSNVKPNLAKLRIAKENELRKSHILGSGAFGTVYKGEWVPEGVNTKLPVAIKVLRDSPGVNTSKQFLEEAFIMASVDHPNLLKLLAVCMTSQMMLITQLMPLGCILDYVRKHKTKIRAKLFLSWCKQIAEGMAFLEEKRLVHRDLAARNVLLLQPNFVKITDFGLAKLLDTNEEAYKADGGKMPIKWLAVECIQHRIFTSKSDVWAFAVTIWELLTYGEKPYGDLPARDLPEKLIEGVRLVQPTICTADVYMLMLQCWTHAAEDRPTFKEVAEKFAKWIQDPTRYIVIKTELEQIQDDQDIKFPIAVENYDTSVDSEEYLQPKMRMPGCSSVRIPISELSLPQNQREALRFNMDHTLGRVCAMKESDTSDELSGGSYNREAQIGHLKLDLPLDDDDYLMPSPQQGQSVNTTASSAAYMDLVGDAKQSDENQNTTRIGLSMNFNGDFLPSHVCVDNPEYHLMSPEQKLGIPTVRQLQHRSSEEESDHEYYNDFDRLQRELQPLHRNTETTV
ncbi:epidermal growth factor receptor isoform X2 [Planococcus citri]|uniref:epidermal growth factor receptor isoform X2 n=1 Tax=Planococcus citri TaxID=170843 RepID=UPI0031F8A56F